MRPGRQITDTSKGSQQRRSRVLTYTLAGMGAVFIAALLFARSMTNPLSGTSATPSAAPAADANHDERPELAAEHSKMLDERLGADDGFALEIFYGGGIEGSLETCG